MKIEFAISASKYSSVVGSSLRALCLVLEIVFVSGCVYRTNAVYSLDKPLFVPQSQPDSVDETGIRQDANTQNEALILQWYSMSNASGFKIFRSDSLGAKGTATNFKLVANVASANSINDTSFVDGMGILPKVTYYYYLTAYTFGGMSSQPSDTISYSLMNRPFLVYPEANSTVSESALFFEWYNYSRPAWYTIRVRDISLVPWKIVWVSKRFTASDPYPSRDFDFDSTASEHLIRGHSYEWRVDRFNVDSSGVPYEGATSGWWHFEVN